MTFLRRAKLLPQIHYQFRDRQLQEVAPVRLAGGRTMRINRATLLAAKRTRLAKTKTIAEGCAGQPERPHLFDLVWLDDRVRVQHTGAAQAAAEAEGGTGRPAGFGKTLRVLAR